MGTNFRMSLVDAAIYMTIENDADPGGGSHRDIYQARPVSAGPPTRFPQGSCVGVAFHGDGNWKMCSRSLTGFPPRQFGKN